MVSEPSLSLIVPISRMAGRLDPLFSWTNKAMVSGLQILWIHDIQDDSTSSELHQFKKDHVGSLHLLEGHYGSPGAARNEGLNLVDTKYFAFADSDDELFVEELLINLEKLKMSTAKILVAPFNLKDSKTGKVKCISAQVYGNKFYSEIAYRTGIWRFIFLTEFFDKMRFETTLLGEDQIFILKAIQRSGEPIRGERCHYSYLINQQTQATNNKNISSELLRLNNITADLLSRCHTINERKLTLTFFTNQIITVIHKLGILAGMKQLKKNFKVLRNSKSSIPFFLLQFTKLSIVRVRGVID